MGKQTGYCIYGSTASGQGNEEVGISKENLGKVLFRSQCGMSLVGVMAAAAILMALTIGTLGIVANLTGAVLRAEGNFEALSQLQLAKIALAVPNACKLNFSGKDLTSGHATISNGQFPKYVVSAGDALSAEPIFPAQVRIQANTMSIVRITNSTAQLAVTFNRNDGGTASAEVFRTLPLAITLNGAGVITNCSTDIIGIGGGGNCINQLGTVVPHGSVDSDAHCAYDGNPASRVCISGVWALVSPSTCGGGSGGN